MVLRDRIQSDGCNLTWIDGIADFANHTIAFRGAYAHENAGPQLQRCWMKPENAGSQHAAGSARAGRKRYQVTTIDEKVAIKRDADRLAGAGRMAGGGFQKRRPYLDRIDPCKSPAGRNHDFVADRNPAALDAACNDPTVVK